MINESSLGVLAKVAGFLGGIVNVVGIVLGYLSSLGLTEMQAYVVLGVIALFAFLFMIKFMAIVTKLLIILLIVFLAVSLIGLI